ncbi:MAG TPA: hypothetical protein VJL39_02545 [Candidatus Paceibacterota bacterium]
MWHKLPQSITLAAPPAIQWAWSNSMRILTISVVALLVVAVAMLFTDPVGGPASVEAMKVYMPHQILQDMVAGSGTTVANVLKVGIAGLSVIALLLIFAIVGEMRSMTRERDALRESLQKAREGQRLEQPELTLEQRLDAAEAEVKSLDRHLTRLEDDEDSDDDRRDRLDDILRSLKLVQDRHEEHASVSAVSSVIDEIQRIVAESGTKVTELHEATDESRLRSLDAAIGAHGAEVDSIELRTESLEAVLGRAHALDKRLVEHTTSESGLIARLRELERTRDRLQVRVKALKPAEQGQPDIGTRITNLAAEIGKLESEIDKVDPDTLRQRLAALGKRMEGLQAQLSPPAQFKQAAE